MLMKQQQMWSEARSQHVAQDGRKMESTGVPHVKIEEDQDDILAAATAATVATTATVDTSVPVPSDSLQDFHYCGYPAPWVSDLTTEDLTT
jgi:hypothetical protein